MAFAKLRGEYENDGIHPDKEYLSDLDRDLAKYLKECCIMNNGQSNFPICSSNHSNNT